MKAGTSWLFKQLEPHPDIFSTPVKEIHYFPHIHTNICFLDFNTRVRKLKSYVQWINQNSNRQDVLRNLRWFTAFLNDPIDDNWFQNLFNERNGKKYCAEYSNMICTLDDKAWQHILATSKNTKVVYTLRDPLGRLWSHTKFHSTFNKTPAALGSWTVDEYNKYFETQDIVNHGRYSNHISRMRRHLSDEQLLICFFDDFRTDPLGELGKIETFLDVSHHQYNQKELQKVHNPSAALEMPQPFLEASRKYIEPELERLDTLGMKIPESWSIRMAGAA